MYLGRIATMAKGRKIKWLALGIGVLLLYPFFYSLPSNATTAVTPSLPPFQDLLGVEKVSLDKKFDIQTPYNQKTYRTITVQSVNGKNTTISVTNNNPVAFVAYWCPHCERTLVMWSQHRKAITHFPSLVFVGYPNGTPFSAAKERALAELNYFHIEGKIYFIIGNQANAYTPKGFPDLYFLHGNKVVHLFGEHTWSVWKEALSTSNPSPSSSVPSNGGCPPLPKTSYVETKNSAGIITKEVITTYYRLNNCGVYVNTQTLGMGN